MENSNRPIVVDLEKHTKETQKIFSNSHKDLREIVTVEGFLRMQDIEFKSGEVKNFDGEPGDVEFKNARFEITEVLSDGRRRGDEIKKRINKYETAKTDYDLFEPGDMSSKVPPEELIREVLKACNLKNSRYGEPQSNIDLMIYLNLKGRYLYPTSPIPEIIEREIMGWRSVSVIFLPYAIVVWAAENAPEFLIQNIGVLKFFGPESPFLWSDYL